MRDKAFSIVENPKYDGFQRGLASMVYNIFDKKNSATRSNKFAGSGIKNDIISNIELADELHKPIIRKLRKRKYNHLL